MKGVSLVVFFLFLAVGLTACAHGRHHAGHVGPHPYQTESGNQPVNPDHRFPGWVFEGGEY